MAPVYEVIGHTDMGDLITYLQAGLCGYVALWLYGSVIGHTNMGDPITYLHAGLCGSAADSV